MGPAAVVCYLPLGLISQQLPHHPPLEGPQSQRISYSFELLEVLRIQLAPSPITHILRKRSLTSFSSSCHGRPWPRHWTEFLRSIARRTNIKTLKWGWYEILAWRSLCGGCQSDGARSIRLGMNFARWKEASVLKEVGSKWTDYETVHVGWPLDKF